MDEGLRGKVALVTGAASGIGAEVCSVLARLGVSVAISDRDIDGARSLAARLDATGAKCLPIELDVRDRGQAQAAVTAAVSSLGPISLAVNNAGISTRRGLAGEQSSDEWDLCLAVNLTGVFHCMQAEIAAMLAADGGSIVNVASISGVIAVPGTAAYTAAKHGVIGLTKTAALDYADRGIRINAVAPGYVDTPLLASRSAEEKQAITLRHPMNRLASPAEIASTIVYLLSSHASFVTGSVHLVDGGYTAR